jgi:outer membrane protein
MLKNYIIIVMAILVWGGAVYSQEEENYSQNERPLRLPDCIEIALENNSTLRNAERRVEFAGADVTSAWSSVLPRINSSISSGKYIQGARRMKTDVPRGMDPETGNVIYEQQVITQDRTERNSYGARISLSQNIWDFGRSSNTIRGAKAIEASSEYSYRDIRLAVILNVKKAYYELLRAIKLVQVYKQAVDYAEEQVEEAKTRLDIGLASQAEVYQARVNLGNNKRDYITQQNLVQIARANLNSALGIDPSTPVEVVEDESETIFPEYTFDEALEIAIDKNQNIKALEMDVKSYYYNLASAKARYMPTIGGSISYSRNNDQYERVFSTDLNEDFTATIGVQLDLNIFNGFADKAAIQKARINFDTAMENLREAKRLLTVDVKQYFLNLEAYRDFLQINKENIQAASENLRLQQERRRVGSGTELEVTQAQVELVSAQSAYVRAEYEAKIARAELETAMGMEEK